MIEPPRRDPGTKCFAGLHFILLSCRLSTCAASESQRSMPTLIITVDLQCCRCSSKIQKILCCIQDRGEFVIDKIVYEKDKVLVSGPFDAEKLSCKLWCKACKIIKNIEVKKEEKKEEPKKEEPKKPEPKPAPCQLVPYPYPYPYPQYPSTCPPCGCPTPYCECHSKQPPPKEPAKTPPQEKPKPPPEPPKPPKCGPCGCPTWPSCHCCSCPPYQPPKPPMCGPCGCPTWPSCRCYSCPPNQLFVCEENPSYGACAIM